MGMRCTICQHRNVLQINKEILAGETWTKIAKTYGVNFQAVRNHAKKHLPKRMVKAFEKKEMAEDLDMMNEFTTLIADIKEQVEIFKREGKDALTIKGIDVLIRLYQTMAQYASAYYQKQAMDNEAERAREQQEQEHWRAENIKVLSQDEKDMQRLLAIKMVSRNEKMDVFRMFYQEKKLQEEYSKIPDGPNVNTEQPEPKQSRIQQSGEADINDSGNSKPERPVRTLSSREIRSRIPRTVRFSPFYKSPKRGN